MAMTRDTLQPTQMLYLLAVVGNTKEPALALAAGEVVYHLAQDLGAHFISLNRLLKEHPKLELVASEVTVTFIETLSCGLFLDSQVEGVAAATADTLFYLVSSENDVWDKLEIRVCLLRTVVMHAEPIHIAFLPPVTQTGIVRQLDRTRGA